MGRRNHMISLMANPKLKFKNNHLLSMHLKSNPTVRAIQAQMTGTGAVRREDPPMEGSGKKKYKPLRFNF